ncbi:Phosphatidylinositol 3,4,5-trisphosphate-dependent Rac exchanger 2 protein [Aphanomyces cochlioides]|nr:Phosphatidylinositol 3,4,5-trisphosphate-dependent Rac exchanger 2 protein [Aphanomyces cochlioides]
MGSDSTLMEISMEDDQRAAPRRQDSLAFFVSVENLNLELPDSGTMFNSAQQTMQRGFALAKTMIKKSEAPAAGAPWEGYTYCQVKLNDVTLRTEAQRASNPSFTIGFTLPSVEESAQSTTKLVFEIVQDKAKSPNIFAATDAIDLRLLVDAKTRNEVLCLPLVDSVEGAVLVLTWPYAMVYDISTVPSFAQTHRTLYRWKTKAATFEMQEDVAEIDLCASLPQQVLAQSLSEFERKAEVWQSLLDRAIMQECRLDDSTAALDRGCDFVRVSVSRARGLLLSAAPAPLASSDSMGQTIRSSMFALAKSVKSSAFSKLKSSSSISDDSTTSTASPAPQAVNAYCELSWHDPKTFDATWKIGRTNAIASSSEPWWTPDAVTTKLHTRIDDKYFEFYRPPNRQLRGYLECQLFHDPSKSLGVSKSSRKAHVPLGFARLDLTQLRPKADDPTTLEFHEWVRVHQREGDSDIVCRCDGAGVQCVGEIEIQWTLRQGVDGAYPAEFDSVPCVTQSDLAWFQGSSTMQIQPMMFSAAFIEKQMSALQGNIATLAKLVEVSQEWVDKKQRFKSSQQKKAWDVQHIPTNLHVSWAQTSPHRILPTVTSGIPSAHALGLDKVDLVSMDEQLVDAIKDCHKLQSALSVQTKAFYGVLGLDNDFTAAVEGGNGADRSSTASQESSPPPPPEEDTPKSNASSRLSSLYSSAKRNLPPVVPPSLSFKAEDKSLNAVVTRVLEVQASYQLRKSVVVAQALTALAASFQSELYIALEQGPAIWTERINQWTAMGYLCGWESLVSSQGKELHMLLDAQSALDACRFFHFQLVLNQDESNHDVRLVGSSIQIPVSPTIFGQLPASWQSGAAHISITCVLFTQGINEMQSLVNMSHLGGVTKQSEINTSNLVVLNKYHEQFKALFPNRTALREIFNQLRDAVINENSANKNTDILHLASQVVRHLRGGRITCCKSGKDRTAMSVTWEQAQWVAAVHNCRVDELDMANTMREWGIRLDIAEKNINQRKYSFNALQRKLLPPIYRPPMTTIQDIVTSVALRDS